MRIPFSVMPEFEGPEPGGLVNLQFNVQADYDEANDIGRSTTNLVMEVYPYMYYWLDHGVPPSVGVAFPICGDEDHGYPVGDLNEDCNVDELDVGIFCQHWLDDNRP
jgi:hypothetical protein